MGLLQENSASGLGGIATKLRKRFPSLPRLNLLKPNEIGGSFENAVIPLILAFARISPPPNSQLALDAQTVMDATNLKEHLFRGLLFNSTARLPFMHALNDLEIAASIDDDTIAFSQAIVRDSSNFATTVQQIKRALKPVTKVINWISSNTPGMIYTGAAITPILVPAFSATPKIQVADAASRSAYQKFNTTPPLSPPDSPPNQSGETSCNQLQLMSKADLLALGMKTDQTLAVLTQTLKQAGWESIDQYAKSSPVHRQQIDTWTSPTTHSNVSFDKSPTLCTPPTVTPSLNPKGAELAAGVTAATVTLSNDAEKIAEKKILIGQLLGILDSKTLPHVAIPPAKLTYKLIDPSDAREVASLLDDVLYGRNLNRVATYIVANPSVGFSEQETDLFLRIMADYNEGHAMTLASIPVTSRVSQLAVSVHDNAIANVGNPIESQYFRSLETNLDRATNLSPIFEDNWALDTFIPPRMNIIPLKYETILKLPTKDLAIVKAFANDKLEYEWRQKLTQSMADYLIRQIRLGNGTMKPIIVLAENSGDLETLQMMLIDAGRIARLNDPYGFLNRSVLCLIDSKTGLRTSVAILPSAGENWNLVGKMLDKIKGVTADSFIDSAIEMNVGELTSPVRILLDAPEIKPTTMQIVSRWALKQFSAESLNALTLKMGSFFDKFFMAAQAAMLFQGSQDINSSIDELTGQVTSAYVPLVPFNFEPPHFDLPIGSPIDIMRSTASQQLPPEMIHVSSDNLPVGLLLGGKSSLPVSSFQDQVAKFVGERVLDDPCSANTLCLNTPSPVLAIQGYPNDPWTMVLANTRIVNLDSIVDLGNSNTNAVKNKAYLGAGISAQKAMLQIKMDFFGADGVTIMRTIDLSVGKVQDAEFDAYAYTPDSDILTLVHVRIAKNAGGEPIITVSRDPQSTSKVIQAHFLQ